MKIKSFGLALGGALVCGVLSFSLTALAQQPPGRPGFSAEKMEAVRVCAAAKGVELPEPPKGPPPAEAKGEKPPAPPEGGKPPEGERGGPPKLTDAQRAVLDACFEANGLTPPKGPPQRR